MPLDEVQRYIYVWLMSKPRNTEVEVKENPSGAFLDAVLLGPSRSIEAMEARGQKELLRGEALPTEVKPEERPFLEMWGFVFGEPYPDDALFAPTQLPTGWSKEGSDHAMWSYILDAKGRKRVAVFYKAAFYDRRAFMRIETRYSCEHPEDGSMVLVDRQTGEVLLTLVKDTQDPWMAVDDFLYAKVGLNPHLPCHWTE